MDTTYTSQLFLSILFFAPGIILFASLAFVGVLMILEKTVFSAQKDVALANVAKPLDIPVAANPQPGAIVAALKESVQAPVAKQQRHAQK